jgi:hypothetical protein
MTDNIEEKNKSQNKFVTPQKKREFTPQASTNSIWLGVGTSMKDSQFRP